MKDYTGRTIFLGIDVHKCTYSVTSVLDGTVIKQDTFCASPEVVVRYCRRAFKGATIKSAYEAGFCGFTLHRHLIKNGIQNIVVHPASIEVESGNRRKNDKRDSKKIAIQLAAGRLQCVYIPALEGENRRYISRLREVFVKQRIRLSCQIKSLLHLNGMIPPETSPRICKKFLTELLTVHMDTSLRFCLEKLANSWLHVSEEILKIEKEIMNLTPNEQVLYDTYLKVPGIGPKIGKILLHELGDTMQFSNEEKLFSFCGLTPTEHSSGEHRRLGHISRQGNPILRKVLVQAAWVAVRKDLYFKSYYENLSKRRGKCRAIVAVARKLIGRIRCAIKKKENYKAEKADSKVVLQEDFVAAS